MEVQFSAEMMRVTDPRDRDRVRYFRLVRTAPTGLHRRENVFTAKNGTKWATGVGLDSNGYAWPLDETTERFEEIFDMEFEARGSRASVAFQGAGTPLYRKQQIREAARRDKAKLYAAMDALTPEEMIAYGQFRAEKLSWIKLLSDR